ncbi:MAG: hypothetical protein R3A78_17085, partial [Polyangiales bacterium]
MTKPSSVRTQAKTSAHSSMARGLVASFLGALPAATLPVLGLSLAATTLVTDAFALGTVKVEQTKVMEADGKWKLKMVIDLGKVPEIAYQPMVFSFTPTMLYERSLTDESGDKPVIIRKPLKNQQSIDESMDVGFSSAT